MKLKIGTIDRTHILTALDTIYQEEISNAKSETLRIGMEVGYHNFKNIFITKPDEDKMVDTINGFGSFLSQESSMKYSLSFFLGKAKEYTDFLGKVESHLDMVITFIDYIKDKSWSKLTIDGIISFVHDDTSINIEASLIDFNSIYKKNLHRIDLEVFDNKISEDEPFYTVSICSDDKWIIDSEKYWKKIELLQLSLKKK